MFSMNVKLIILLYYNFCNFDLISTTVVKDSSSLKNRLNDTLSADYNNYCINSECNQTAVKVLEYMDSNIEPCDNFYEFACGNFLKTTVISHDEFHVDNFGFIQDEIQLQMKNLLEQEAEPNEPKHVKLLKNFYQNCMNSTTIKQNSLQLALNILNKIGGWSVLGGDSLKADTQWEHLASKVKNETGLIIGFFSLRITSDLENSSKSILQLEQPTIFPLVGDSYYNYMVNIAVIFGADKVKAPIELSQILNLKNKLLNADWLDNITKNVAQEKLRAVKISIGYADELLDNNELDKFYRNLEINPGDFLQSFINISKFDSHDNNLRKPFNKTSWIHQESCINSNARYVAHSNSMELQAGVLQGVFFNSNKPQYMNYGAIGSVIGHEINHAFDDFNSNYDKEGNYVDWWQPEAKEQFLLKTHCIISQYRNYTDNKFGIKLKSTGSQGENIADNGGIKTSYLAYRKWVDEHGPEVLLPGLNYTQLQLFWISYAQSLCIKMTPDAMRYILNDETHFPAEFRVIGSLSNQPEFANDFKCANGTKMNPEMKCSIW